MDEDDISGGYFCRACWLPFALENLFSCAVGVAGMTLPVGYLSAAGDYYLAYLLSLMDTY